MDELSPLQMYFLVPMRENLKSMFTVKYLTEMSALLVVRNAFTLGMVVGFVMNQFVRHGHSFNKMDIDVSNFTVRLQVLKEATANKLQVSWRQK